MFCCPGQPIIPSVVHYLVALEILAVVILHSKQAGPELKVLRLKKPHMRPQYEAPCRKDIGIDMGQLLFRQTARDQDKDIADQ